MLEGFESIIVADSAYFWKIVLYWWWLPLFFYLNKQFLYFWVWWRRQIWKATIYKPMYIEVKIPKVILKPVKAMETVIASIHGAVYDPADWWETWFDGKFNPSTCFDIVSDGGNIHFYIRFHSDYRESVEAAVYSQFPEAEIEAVPDYTKNVPEDIPNTNWNLRGWDYKLEKDSYYPLKTYEEYEEPGAEEEEKVDPISTLMEALSKMKTGEQMWIQIWTVPLGGTDQKKFVKDGEKLKDKLAFRKEAKPVAPLWSSLIKFVFHGAEEEEEEKADVIPLEMKLTPGERKVIENVERKISKPIFGAGVRVIYLGKTEVWFKPNFRLALSYFNNFNDTDLNSLAVWGETFTRYHKMWFLPMNYLKGRIEYVKKRHLLRVYKDRDNYYDPFDDHVGRFVLSTEELASLYHFPSHEVAPTPGIHRTEAKETVAPHNLPT